MRAAFYIKCTNSVAASGIVLLSLMTLWGTAHAATGGSAVSQGYQASTKDTAIVSGALVSTKSGSPQEVQAANDDTATNLVGIVNNSPLVALSGSDDQVQVVITGSASVIVSDINGAIHVGDKITASPIDGVGMKATYDSEVVGSAQEDFNTASAHTETVKDDSGKSRTVHIGTILVQVSPSYYATSTSSFLPPFLQGFANSLAGKPVSPIRVMIAIVLILVSFAAIFTLVYSSIRSGIISIGRNPLAAKAITKGMIEVGVSTILIVIFALIAAYLILSI